MNQFLIENDLHLQLALSNIIAMSRLYFWSCMFSRYLLVVGLLCFSYAVNAESLSFERFVASNLGEHPQAMTLWLKPPLKKRAEAILDHPYQGLRVRYWQANQRTAWIIDEIGKEQPITTGVIVENGKILAVEVLAYRESRGGEVQQSFFTRQFHGLTLTSNDKLNKKIDGITGATLSVWALQKTARLALMFDAEKDSANKL